MFSGDPVQDRGYIDRNFPGDRYFYLSSGPFTLAPGDSQEVVAAKVIAIGSDRLDSITQLRNAARMAHLAYYFDFRTPKFQPPAPRVVASTTKNVVVLSWDDAAEEFQFNTSGDLPANALTFRWKFEGYNVYQLSKPEMDSATQAMKIATFDVVDEIMDVWDLVHDEASGEDLLRPVQTAFDTGLRRYLLIDQDRLRHRPITYGREVYFAVTSYAVVEGEPSRYSLPRVLESDWLPVAVTPANPLPGRVLPLSVGDTLYARHTRGSANGVVMAIVLHPEQLAQHEYTVEFDSAGGGTTWSARREDGTVVVSSWENQTGDENYPVVDGFLLKVIQDSSMPNTPDDQYSFRTPRGVPKDIAAAFKEIDQINVFPNPYYGRNKDEIDALHRFVTFTHLPEHATLRIFTLGGKLVRELEHRGPSTFHRWDLRNEIGVAVASGMYIVHIDMPEFGVSKVLKLAVFQPEDRPPYLDWSWPVNYKR